MRNFHHQIDDHQGPWSPLGGLIVCGELWGGGRMEKVAAYVVETAAKSALTEGEGRRRTVVWRSG